MKEISIIEKDIELSKANKFNALMGYETNDESL